MSKEKYLLISIPCVGIGDQLVRFSTMVHWARMSSRSLIVKSGIKNYWGPYARKRPRIFPGFGLLLLLLCNKPSSVFKILLGDNVLTTSLILPRRIDGVAVYSVDECGFFIKLAMMRELIKNHLSSRLNDLLSKIHKRKSKANVPPPSSSKQTASPSPILKRLRKKQRVDFMPDLDLDCIEASLKHTKEILKEVRLMPELDEKAAEFAENNFAGKKVIGVHIRYSPPGLNNHSKLWVDEDKVLHRLKDAVQKAFDREDPRKTVIFLAADQQHVLDTMKKHFGPKLIHRPQKLGNKINELIYSGIMDNKELWDNAAVDMFLLSRVDKLLYNSDSWFLLYAKSKVKDSARI